MDTLLVKIGNQYSEINTKRDLDFYRKEKTNMNFLN